MSIDSRDSLNKSERICSLRPISSVLRLIACQDDITAQSTNYDHKKYWTTHSISGSGPTLC